MGIAPSCGSLKHSLSVWEVCRGSMCTLMLYICPARQVNAERKHYLYQHPLTHPQPSDEHEDHRRPSPVPSLLLIGIGVCWYSMTHTIYMSLLLLALDLQSIQEEPPVPLPCSSCWHQHPRAPEVHGSLQLLALRPLLLLFSVHTYSPRAETTPTQKVVRNQI